MFSLFGILKPRTGQPVPSEEAPFKRSFFGAPVDPAAVPVAAEEDALYLTGKRPEPPERPPHK
ncbi:hypothetical protein [Devosia ginsengisoli]|uniref:hypothetical protein n=1 Tax=Devosia ginsengisoli TaxID=400770 RepID=UPI0026EF0D32|nr:hypothetical protein [Devosia ginsengisoli]MCR6672440.1 hypothetical protein [Devosia ginsengisoli]